MATRKLSLSEPLAFGQVTERCVDERILFIDPQRATWIALAPDEADVFRRLIKGETIGSLFACEPTVPRETLSRLASRIIQAGFLGDRTNLSESKIGTKRVQIHLTNRCNLRCVHCYMDSGVWLTAETETKRWLTLLDALSVRFEEVQLSVSGGEPLLSMSLFPILEHAKTLGMQTAMITNGLLLRRNVLARISSLLNVCAISLDGLSSETHDQIRGPGTFARTYANLLGLSGTQFRKILNITVLRTNKDELRHNLRNFLRTLPFAVDVDLGALVFEGRGTQRRDLAVGRDEFREVLSAVGEALLSEQLAGEVLVGADGSTLWKGTPPRARQSCGYGDTLVIYSNGSVSTCLTPRFIRGNIFDGEPGNLLDAIESERAAVRLDRLEECKACDLRHICGGRCHLSQLRAGKLPSQVDCPQSYKDSMFRNLAAWGSSG